MAAVTSYPAVCTTSKENCVSDNTTTERRTWKENLLLHDNFTIPCNNSLACTFAGKPCLSGAPQDIQGRETWSPCRLGSRTKGANATLKVLRSISWREVVHHHGASTVLILSANMAGSCVWNSDTPQSHRVLKDKWCNHVISNDSAPNNH
jgi:hypothetical protein